MSDEIKWCKHGVPGVGMCIECMDEQKANSKPPTDVSSGSFAGSIEEDSSVVADYVAFCTVCNGWVGVADASTPEMKKRHQGDVATWIDDGYRVELIEHGPNEPMPKQCNC